jgi:hypothetical protein
MPSPPPILPALETAAAAAAAAPLLTALCSFVSASLRAVLSLLIRLSQASYIYFKAYEPKNPLLLAALLLVAPGALSVVWMGSTASTYAATASAFLSYWSFLVIFTVVYRISPFHPLARYPGPRLARVTKWYSVYKIIQGKQHLHYKRLHDTYGNTVRVGACVTPIRLDMSVNVEKDQMSYQSTSHLSYTRSLDTEVCLKALVRSPAHALAVET